MRWNREKDKSVVKSRPDGTHGDARPVIAHRDRPVCGAECPAAADAAYSVRQGAGASIQNTRRDDIWQGYQRLIGCANRFLYMENRYFREPRMADAIVDQPRAQKELVVIVVVPSEADDLPDAGKKHGDSRQHQFFVRLTNGMPKSRTRRVHDVPPRSFIQVHHGRRPRAVPARMANANPRGFFLDSELNVMLDGAETVQAFRHRLWAHNLGVAETTVAGWNASAFIAGWDAVAAANEALRSHPEKMTGEAVIKFDTPGRRASGKQSSMTWRPKRSTFAREEGDMDAGGTLRGVPMPNYSPFLDVRSFEEAEEEAPARAEESLTRGQPASPFLAVYESEGEGRIDPQTEE